MRLENIRNNKLHEIAFMLKLATVLCKETLDKSLQVIKREVRRELTTVAIERIARHVTKKTLRRDFVGAPCALNKQ